MFFQHFIECIFHFNNYEKHEKYNKFPQSERSVRLPGELGEQQVVVSCSVCMVRHRPQPMFTLWDCYFS